MFIAGNWRNMIILFKFRKEENSNDLSKLIPWVIYLIS